MLIRATKQLAAFALGLICSWYFVHNVMYDLEAHNAEKEGSETTVAHRTEDSLSMSREVHVDFTNPVVQKIVERHRRAFASVSASNVYLIVLVKSSPQSRIIRDTLRTSWFIRDNKTHRSVPNRLIYQYFLVGRTGDEKADKLVQQENFEYEDIIQVPFTDTYSLLAPKVLFGVSLAASRHTFEYMLVSNDDIVVNWQTLLPWLATSPRRQFYAGSKVTNRRVSRDSSSQFYVPPAIYKPDVYPPMANGYGYIMSSDVVYTVLAEASKEYLVGEDDAMVGILASQAGIDVTHVKEFRVSGACNVKFPFLLSGLNHHAIRKKHNDGLQRTAVC